MCANNSLCTSHYGYVTYIVLDCCCLSSITRAFINLSVALNSFGWLQVILSFIMKNRQSTFIFVGQTLQTSDATI